MIPTVEDVLADLAAGRIGVPEALRYIKAHMMLAEERGALKK